MQYRKSDILKKVSSFITFILVNLFVLTLWAQTPTHIPRERTPPADFFESTENIIFFIVIPVIIVVLYFLWRRERAKEQKKFEEEQNDK
ncbi:MAG: hypothetical protein EA393_11145 [Bacteroidetes bacterium]|nr:MAG: hypothetical protein EA393_11145 [Bacteroidota bacterium]